MDTQTENDDPSYTTTANTLLDYFAGVCRPTTDELLAKIPALLESAWKFSPQLTIRAIFHKRDCRKGAGERQIFYQSVEWLLTKPNTSELVATLIPEYGCFRDLFELPSLNLKQIARVFSDAMKRNNMLAYKWLPSQQCAWHRHHPQKFSRFVTYVLNDMKVEYNESTKYATYRKMISAERHKQIVEVKMSANRFGEITYSHVPSKAMLNYRNAFKKRDGTRFNKHIASVLKGESKINTAGLMVHEIIQRATKEEDAALLAQWNAIVEQVRTTCPVEGVLVMSDVSGSMIGLPMNVSIALGLLFYEISPMHSILTFSEKPFFYEFPQGATLYEKATYMQSKGGLNTDLRLAFHTLLDKCKEERLSPPKTVIIISDMQFDAIGNSSSWNESTFKSVKKLYAKNNMRFPEIVFWNVKGNVSSFPVQNSEIGVTMISGFSQNLLEGVLCNETLNPMSAMMKTLNSQRYEMIQYVF